MAGESVVDSVALETPVVEDQGPMSQTAPWCCPHCNWRIYGIHIFR